MGDTKQLPPKYRKEKAINKSNNDVEFIFKIDAGVCLKPRKDNPFKFAALKVQRALPCLNEHQNEWVEEKGSIGTYIFLAGDHLLYGITNVAMVTGELAAKALIASLTK